MKDQLDPSHIMQTATAFWASKVLLTAVELELFTALGDGTMTAPELGTALDLHPRGTYDFFDALVALKFLDRDGDGPQGKYKNTHATAAFLDEASPNYIGGLPQMLNARLFGFWNDLGAALKTGQPQNEVKLHGKPMFEELYANEARLGLFLEAMTGVQGRTSRSSPRNSTFHVTGRCVTSAAHWRFCPALSRRGTSTSRSRRSICRRWRYTHGSRLTRPA